MLRFGSIGVLEGTDGGKPMSRGLPPAAFWETETKRFYRYPLGEATQPRPVTNGAGLLRFGSIETVEGADGGKPTRRGLPPAAFWETETNRLRRYTPGG